MRFLAITLIATGPDPVTGVQPGTTQRFREVIDNALLAEELGFDGFGVGERHERPFISSSPPVVLSHIAALTRAIRLFTAVTTLSLLDPVRAYEDYATLDHLSGGRPDQRPAPRVARAVPVRHRAGAAPRHPRSAVAVGPGGRPPPPPARSPRPPQPPHLPRPPPAAEEDLTV
jgi:alkanesulfonate monooxygenase SsuD/methylene tetrahydromethanopterin reductase-like flavin-dependent oxidoreductase (luciferase family)